MQSSLARHVPDSPASAEDIDRLARAAWRARGVALIDPARLADPWEAQVVRNVATRLFGPRPEPNAEDVGPLRRRADAGGRAFRDW